VKNLNFRQRSKFSPKIQIFAKNPNFRQKSKFLPKIQIFAKNPNFRQTSQFCLNILTKNLNFGQKSVILKSDLNILANSFFYGKFTVILLEKKEMIFFRKKSFKIMKIYIRSSRSAPRSSSSKYTNVFFSIFFSNFSWIFVRLLIIKKGVNLWIDI